MKIGDKVRFLNDVGGGVITGFQGKDMVLVCGEDGFEIPTLTKDVVVVETDNYNIAKKVQKTSNQPTESPRPTSVKQALSATDEEDTADEEIDLADKEMSYTPMAQERRGADTVNLFLAFTPADKGRPEAGPYEVYLVNDCNYYIRFALTTVTEDVSTLRHEGELAPNTKFFWRKSPLSASLNGKTRRYVLFA